MGEHSGREASLLWVHDGTGSPDELGRSPRIKQERSGLECENPSFQSKCNNDQHPEHAGEGGLGQKQRDKDKRQGVIRGRAHRS